MVSSVLQASAIFFPGEPCTEAEGLRQEDALFFIRSAVGSLGQKPGFRCPVRIGLTAPTVVSHGETDITFTIQLLSENGIPCSPKVEQFAVVVTVGSRIFCFQKFHAAGSGQMVFPQDLVDCVVAELGW